MDAAWLTFLGVILGAVVAQVGNYYTNRWALDREKERTERESRLAREAAEREAAERAREHLLDLYSNALLTTSLASVAWTRNYEQDAEWRRALLLLAANHPYVGTKQYEDFVKKAVATGLKSGEILDLMGQDPRLKPSA